jgi:hypothetical protein
VSLDTLAATATARGPPIQLTGVTLHLAILSARKLIAGRTLVLATSHTVAETLFQNVFIFRDKGTSEFLHGVFDVVGLCGDSASESECDSDDSEFHDGGMRGMGWLGVVLVVATLLRIRLILHCDRE